MPEGCVPVGTVVVVLQSFGVSASQRPDGSYRFEKGDMVEVVELPPDVGRRVVIRLGKKFEIESRYFWNPEQIKTHNGPAATPVASGE